MDDAGLPLTYAQVFETTDNGKTFAALGTPIDPTVDVTTIDVTRTDPNRIYVSGTRGYGASKSAWLFVSHDKGATWSQSPITQFDPNSEAGIYIAAIDPTNADRVYLRSAGTLTGGQSRIFYTVNGGAAGGATFSLPGSLPADGGFTAAEAMMNEINGEILGFAITPDGATAFAGTVQSGLWMAKTSDMQFKQVNAGLHVHCLQTRTTAQGTELWACGDILSGFTLGVSTDNGATFKSKMQYVTSVCGPVECAPNPGGPLGCGADDNASVCATEEMDSYQAFCLSNDVSMACGVCIDTSTDAGATAPDGGASTGDSGKGGGSSGSSSCSLSQVGSRGGGAGLVAGLAFVGLAIARRRERRP
jgi:hypothetical protein